MILRSDQRLQLTGEARTPVALKPGHMAKIDYEYRRDGVASVWMFSEPLALGSG